MDERLEADRFSEELDKLLSGGATAPRDEEHAKDLEFAGKLARLDLSRQSRVKDSLKASLMLRAAKKTGFGALLRSAARVSGGVAAALLAAFFVTPVALKRFAPDMLDQIQSMITGGASRMGGDADLFASGSSPYDSGVAGRAPGSSAGARLAPIEGAGSSGIFGAQSAGGAVSGSKSVGESLEFLRQKQEMEKALDLKWKMKEKRAMFPLELQQEAAKTIVMDGVVKPLAGGFGDLVKTVFSRDSSQVWVCSDRSQYKNSEVGAGFASCAQGKKYYQTGVNNGIQACGGGSGGNSNPTGGSTGCVLTVVGGSSNSTGDSGNQVGRPGNDPFAGGTVMPSGQSLAQLCSWLASDNNPDSIQQLRDEAATISAVINKMKSNSGVSCAPGTLKTAMSYADNETNAVSKVQADWFKDLQANAALLETQVTAYNGKLTPMKQKVAAELTQANGANADLAKAAVERVMADGNFTPIKTMADPFVNPDGSNAYRRAAASAPETLTAKGLEQLQTDLNNALGSGGTEGGGAGTGLRGRVAAARTAVTAINIPTDASTLTGVTPEGRQYAERYLRELNQWKGFANSAVTARENANTRLQRDGVEQLASLRTALSGAYTQTRDSLHGPAGENGTHSVKSLSDSLNGAAGSSAITNVGTAVTGVATRVSQAPVPSDAGWKSTLAQLPLTE